MEFLYKRSKLQHFLIALMVSSAIAYVRYSLEARLTNLVVDAQAGIVIVFAFITSILLFVFLTICLYKFFRAKVDSDTNRANKFLVFSLMVVALSGYSITNSINKRSALLDSTDPHTGVERLRDLVGYQSGFGYEVDNRIASNPSTPVDVLESLYGIQGQIGTDMSLALNPNTPNYILIALSKRRDEFWRPRIIERLEKNPKVKSGELFFDEKMVLHETKNAEDSN
ncbi:hypothetical protein [uncultured Alteromonas sp.]|jgi:hypothetical protein|uniref:hypothetical protein n=1 Tax=uncultured Alteromonas sp. TaxID=179113 RepID=UPI0025D233C0|nr:hypothetical protein [uncultured Alteromonas sp.]